MKKAIAWIVTILIIAAIVLIIIFVPNYGSDNSDTPSFAVDFDRLGEEVAVDVFADGEYSVVPAESIVMWQGSKSLGDGTHFGAIGVVGGVEYQNGAFADGGLVMDTDSITVLDIAADNERNAQLVEHLKGEDFFNAVNDRDIIFALDAMETAGEGAMVSGTLTMNDTTQPFEIAAGMSELTDREGHYHVVAEFSLPRKDWNIGTGSALAEVGLDDNIDLIASLLFAPRS